MVTRADPTPTPRMIHIERLDQDADIPTLRRELAVEVRTSEDPEAPARGHWSFIRSGELHVPFLLDLPLRTSGDFTELVIDVNAPLFPTRKDYVYEVDLILRGKVIETKTYRNATQRHVFILSTQLLFEDVNELSLTARQIAGDSEETP